MVLQVNQLQWLIVSYQSKGVLTHIQIGNQHQLPLLPFWHNGQLIYQRVGHLLPLPIYQINVLVHKSTSHQLRRLVLHHRSNHFPLHVPLVEIQRKLVSIIRFVLLLVESVWTSPRITLFVHFHQLSEINPILSGKRNFWFVAHVEWRIKFLVDITHFLHFHDEPWILYDIGGSDLPIFLHGRRRLKVPT